MNSPTHGMRFRTIQKTIRNKLNAWLESIPDEKLRKLLADNTIVTGGAIASMAAGEGANDYDVYFRTKEAAREAALYYASQFAAPTANNTLRVLVPQVRTSHITNLKGEEERRLVFWIQSAGAVAEKQAPYEFFESRPDWETQNFIESLGTASAESGNSAEQTEKDFSVISAGVKSLKGDAPFRPIFFSNNAVTLSDDVQLVIRFFGEPDQIHTNYDFAHCMGYYDYKADKMTVSAETMQCILERTLVYKGSLYPICSVLRLRKFLARGWRIDAGEIIKLCANVAEVNYQNANQLQEQLMGVDAAYMSQFINALRSALKKGERITPTYFAQLIDKCYD